MPSLLLEGGEFATEVCAALLEELRERGVSTELPTLILIDGSKALREGMEETLTVVRLGVGPTLRRTLSTTNTVESALSVTRMVTARVKRWRPGDMRQRWCAAGLLRAEAKFRRIKGYRELPELIRKLEALSECDIIDHEEKVA